MALAAALVAMKERQIYLVTTAGSEEISVCSALAKIRERFQPQARQIVLDRLLGGMTISVDEGRLESRYAE